MPVRDAQNRGMATPEARVFRWVEQLGNSVRRSADAGLAWWRRARTRVAGLLREEHAQGTTEYAILVGVLVVIAIIAIVAFRDRVSELWNAISEGINSL